MAATEAPPCPRCGQPRHRRPNGAYLGYCLGCHAARQRDYDRRRRAGVPRAARPARPAGPPPCPRCGQPRQRTAGGRYGSYCRACLAERSRALRARRRLPRAAAARPLGWHTDEARLLALEAMWAYVVADLAAGDPDTVAWLASDDFRWWAAALDIAPARLRAGLEARAADLAASAA